MAGKRLAERAGRHANHHIRHIKALRENVGRNQPVNGGIGTAEILDSLALKFVVVVVADRDKVISSLGKLVGKIGPMRHASGKYNRFARPAKYFMGFFDPFSNNIAGNLDAALGGVFLAPLASNLLRTFHVDFLRHKHAKRGQPSLLDKFLGRGGGDNSGVSVRQSIGERRGRQPNDTGATLARKFRSITALRMAFVDDDKIAFRE